MATSRTQQSRQAEEIHKSYDDQWTATSMLDTKNIPARDGYVQRWIRTKVRGVDDQDNVFRRINEGWQPRPISTIEKGKFVPNIDFNGVDVVGIHGMILMERPIKTHESQGRHVRELAARQMQGVRENMFNAHVQGSGMTAPTMRNDTSVSRGRVPEIADD